MVQRQHETLDNDDRATIAQGRSRIYWLLSRFYLSRPDPAFLSRLKELVKELPAGESEGVDLLARALGGEDEPSLTGHGARAAPEYGSTRAMTGWFPGNPARNPSGAPGATKSAPGGFVPEGEGDNVLRAFTVTQRLAVEYTRLFHGLKQEFGPPPPYESLYRPGLPGEVSALVSRFYSEAGYGAIYEPAAPPDHLGLELKFMALLCHDEAVAWQTGQENEAIRLREFQQLFFKSHLLRWAPGCCNRLKGETAEPFYLGVALLTAEALDREEKILEKLRTEKNP